MESNILIDYLTITFKIPGFENELMDMLCFPMGDEVQPTRNRNYDRGMYFMGVRIMWNTESGQVMLDCTGQGCRTLESLNPNFSWEKLLGGLSDLLTTKNNEGQYIAHVARLDLAYDIFDSDSITVNRILKYINNGQYACLSGRFKHDIATDNFGDTVIENTLYIGSPASDRFLRIYDKAIEQRKPERPWVRFEMQCRNDNALSVVLNLIKYDFDIGYVYKGILRDYIRFLTRSRDCVDQKHISSIPTCRWWLELLSYVGAIKQLYAPGIPYNAGNLYRYIHKQVSSSLRAFVSLNDGDLTELLNIIESAKLNFKQRQLIELERLKETIEYPDLPPG